MVNISHFRALLIIQDVHSSGLANAGSRPRDPLLGEVKELGLESNQFKQNPSEEHSMSSLKIPQLEAVSYNQHPDADSQLLSVASANPTDSLVASPSSDIHTNTEQKMTPEDPVQSTKFGVQGTQGIFS